MTLGNNNGTDGQIDRRTDRQTDGETDRQSATHNAAPPREESRIKTVDSSDTWMCKRSVWIFMLSRLGDVGLSVSVLVSLKVNCFIRKVSEPSLVRFSVQFCLICAYLHRSNTELLIAKASRFVVRRAGCIQGAPIKSNPLQSLADNSSTV